MEHHQNTRAIPGHEETSSLLTASRSPATARAPQHTSTEQTPRTHARRKDDQSKIEEILYFAVLNALEDFRSPKTILFFPPSISSYVCACSPLEWMSIEIKTCFQQMHGQVAVLAVRSSSIPMLSNALRSCITNAYSRARLLLNHERPPLRPSGDARALPPNALRGGVEPHRPQLEHDACKWLDSHGLTFSKPEVGPPNVGSTVASIISTNSTQEEVPRLNSSRATVRLGFVSLIDGCVFP